MRGPLHVPTVGIVVAAMVTGSLLTVAGVTLTEAHRADALTVPTVGTPTPAPTTEAPTRTTEGTAPEVYDAGEGTAREAWAACVQHALTTPGMGSDADMIACDDAYVAASGDTTTLWLWCPGAPEEGGCRAEDGPYPAPTALTDDAKEDAADTGGEVGADEWPQGTEPAPSDPALVEPTEVPTVGSEPTDG